MNDLFSQSIRVVSIRDIKRVNSILNYVEKNNPDRPDHGLIYKVSGHVRYHIGSQVLDFSPGMVCYLPKGISYVIERPEPGEAIRISFDTADELDAAPFSALYPNSAAFETLFTRIVAVSKTSVSPFDYRVVSILYEILALLQAARSSYVSFAQKSRIERAAARLRESYADSQLSPAALADELGLSVSGLRSGFGRVYGMPPVRYLGQLRVNAAKELLCSTDLSIAEIAARTGFSDRFYFSKFFHRFCGVSPGDYRRMML